MKGRQKIMRNFYSATNVGRKLNSTTFFPVESHAMNIKGNFPVAEGDLESFASYLCRRKLGRKHKDIFFESIKKYRSKLK